jgi:hypothetical protein
VEGYDLIKWMVSDAFYRPTYHPFKTAYMPLLISELAAGRTELLRAWVVEDLADMVKGEGAWAWGLYFTANCQDDAPTSSVELLSRQAAAYPELDGYSRQLPEMEICEAWGLPSSEGLLVEPVHTDIPTLVVAGSYDPITPAEWSRTALVNFSTSTFLEFPAAGHSVFSTGPCPMEIATAFFNDPTAELDISCMDEMPRPQFILPDEIIISPAMYELHWNELGASQLEENIFFGSFYLQAGAAVLILAVGLVRLIRKKRFFQRGRASRLTQPFAVVVPALCLIWALWLTYILRSVAQEAPIILRFGLPVETWPVFAAAALIGLLTLTLAGLVVLAWRRGYWTLFQRILVSISALGALGFSGILGYWGWFTALFSLL